MPTGPDLVEELYAALAGLVAPGETISKADLNARIRQLHDDPAEVRRALVERGLLLRSPGMAEYRAPGIGSAAR